MYHLTRDSSRKTYGTRERIHSDYYDVAIKLSKLYIDSTVLKLKSCINSYEKHLNSILIYDLDKKATIIKYESIIDEAINKGFHHKIDITQFLTKEDKVFHTFLYQS